ncbi:MAG TPA: hypothetical protein DEB06_03310 [Phycisphaerales bacterium]|nr:hypothetical protein [Phycisphaerales bacterium]
MRTLLSPRAGLIALMLAAPAPFTTPAPALAALPPYTPVGTFQLPAGTHAYTVAPDGRLLAIVGPEILAQSELNGSAFSRLGGVDPALVPSFGASFLEVSPDGGRLAIGDNGLAGAVHLVSAGALDPAPGAFAPTTPVAVPNNFTAHFLDSDTLLVGGSAGFGAASFVEELTALGAPAPLTRTVITNIDGAPGGLASRNGFLFTGNGFDNGPGGSETGEVRAFPLASLALAPMDFEGAGIPVADALSAVSLGFDALGNLLVGGGDFFGSGDAGYAAVIDSDAIDAALWGAPVAPIAPDSAELRLVPATPLDFYSIRHNPVTNELLVSAFGSDTVYRYAVPAPGSLAALALIGLAVGRRRHGA